ncbi:MAG: iron-containing alcohol dehydrogenase family protein [bacterium]|nr:iron-containing alcohol dehydrogenase family protein [bacterium]
MNISPKLILEGTDIFFENIQLFGTKPIIIIKKDVHDKFKNIIENIKNPNFYILKTDCSYEQANLILKTLTDETAVIGIGGGKVLDLAKLVAYRSQKKMITVPTSAATGAAASALSAIYTEDGANIGYELLNKAPDLLILDYALILDAPLDFLKFGAADALAKYYETLASTAGSPENIFIQTALDLATNIKNYIFQNLEMALLAAKNKQLTNELKNIIKINIILAPIVGGFGGESCRAVAAHALNNSMTQIPKMRKFLHGEVVALGNIFQLMLEKKMDELKKLKNLHKKIGLMEDFSYYKVKLKNSEIETLLAYLISEKETLNNMPQNFTKNSLRKHLKKLAIS